MARPHARRQGHAGPLALHWTSGGSRAPDSFDNAGWKKIVREQLFKAGVQLATVLNGLSELRSMPEIFISYSRIDRDFVEELRTRFTAVGRDPWVDVTDIPPTAKWRSEILSSIEQANAFVFVVSPDSIVSRECLRELAHAVKHNKRIVPVVCRES
ncbi:MAG TPA: TIR domain-containing protein [Vicinamibacterales bacterium]|nr:TIR domain-containing protein [Vicinamibacterales bacterium]